jgi:hypothetical protein
MPRRSLIVLIFFVFCASFSSVNVNADQSRFSSAISPNYGMGIDHFQTTIDYLIEGIGEEDPVEWAKKLKKHVSAMHTSFNISLEESQTSKTALDEEAESLAVQSSKIDDEVENTEIEVGKLESETATQQRQVFFQFTNLQCRI